MSEPTDSLAAATKIATASCLDLFADYGVTLTQVSAQSEVASSPLLVVGIIGFTGEGVRGTVVLGMSGAPLRRSNPLPDSGNDWNWIAELTNQLLGRIKSGFTARGLTIYMAMPAVVRGDRIAPVPCHAHEPIVFSSGDGLVCTWFDALWDPGCVLAAEPDDGRGGLNAGTAVMF